MLYVPYPFASRVHRGQKANFILYFVILRRLFQHYIGESNGLSLGREQRLDCPSGGQAPPIGHHRQITEPKGVLDPEAPFWLEFVASYGRKSVGLISDFGI